MILSNSRTPNWSWLSNFHPCEISYNGLVYPSVENLYQAMKTLDESQHVRFIGITAAESKALADANPITTPNWRVVKNDFMRIGLRQKFQYPELRQKLLDTGVEPIYHLSPWDLYWGVNKEMVGENVLGQMIMEIRDSLYGNQFNLLGY